MNVIYVCTYTRAKVGRAGFDEVDKAGAAIELGKEESSIGLGIGGVDPVKTRLNNTVITAAFAKDSTAIATHPHG